MKSIAIVSCCCCLLGGSLAFAQPSEPYRAYISVDQAPVRSGPGKVHYATDQLELGTVVEVYRHDPGGWHAVRPPDGSYSWVRATDLNRKKGDLAEVAGEAVTAWVGTRLAQPEELLWQVRLRAGELVELRGEKQIQTGDAGTVEKWHKISPPAGEFRWINEQHLMRNPPPLAATRRSSANASSSTGSKDSETQADTPSAFQEVGPVTAIQPAPATDSGAPSTGAVSEIQLPPGEFSSQIRSVEIALSQLVAAPPDQWQFDRLRDIGLQLAAHARTDAERLRATQLTDKILKFENLKRRWITQRPADESSSDSPEASDDLVSDDGNSTNDDAVSQIDPRYDGAGKLVPVHTQTPGAPSYALLDKEGNVVQYITPAPGLNLNRYLKKEIGIYGQRGFIPQLNIAHLTAHRIIVLERHRR